MSSAEFISDPTSPAMGRGVYSLKIAPVDFKKIHGPRELVKFRRASEHGYREVIEAGAISTAPGVRVLRLWRACGPDFSLLPVEEAIAKSESRNDPPVIFLASARLCGGLAVTSQLGYENTRKSVRIPSANRLYTSKPVAAVALSDAPARKTIDELSDIHIAKAEILDFDPNAQAELDAIDLALAKLLAAIPEALY